MTNAERAKKWREANPEKAREIKRKHYEANREKVKARSREWGKANPEKKRASSAKSMLLKRRKERASLASRPMPAACEICGCPPSGTSSATSTLHWDHDHRSGAFRGWLCHRCNLTLGQVNDDIALLEKLITYLNQNRPILVAS